MRTRFDSERRLLATTDSNTDSLFAHRMATMEARGFDVEDAMRLVNAKKVVVRKSSHRTYEYEVPVTWHDVKRLQDGGASHEQVLRILG